MDILAHGGITQAAVELLNMAFSKGDPPLAKQYDVEDHTDSSVVVPTRSLISLSNTSGLVSLVKQIDVRLLLIGSLLPDIFDKPVGLYLFKDTFNNGRLFCHTLLFLLLITITGVYIYRERAKVWLLVLSFGILTHLILDQLWLEPRTLLWPLYGFSFKKLDASEWVWNTIHKLLTDPGIYVPELIGGVVLAWFIWMLVRDGKVRAFIKNGRVL